MPIATFSLKALPPADALRKLSQALAEGFGEVTVDAFSVQTNLEVSYAVPEGRGIDTPTRAAGTIELLESFASIVTLRAMTVIVPESSQDRRVIVRYTSENDILASLSIEIKDHSRYQQQIVRIVTAFSNHFDFARRPDLLGESLPEIEREKLRYYERSLSELQSAISKLGSVATSQIEQQAEYLTKKVAEINENAQKQAEEQRKEHEEKLALVEKERLLLLKEREEFDTRRATIARRGLLADMRKLIDKEFAVSKGTNSRRWIIHIVCSVAMIAGVSLAVIGLHELLSAPTFDWRFMGASWSGILFAASTLIFYLRWNNHWFSTLARQEFNTRKLNVDVLRASWVAEMLMEWNDEKGKEFPKELLTSFTEGLFRPSEWTATDHHPLSDASRIMADLSKLKIDKDGLEINRKG